MSFKICQLKTAERQIPKHRISFTDCHPVIAMHYTTNSFNSTHFTHRVELKSQSRLHRCHKVMRALQSHRLNYILKGRARGGRCVCLCVLGVGVGVGGQLHVLLHSNVTVMKCQDTGMESS